MSLLDTDGLRERVERLAAIERGSAGPGERRSAGLIAAELESLGCDVSVELVCHAAFVATAGRTEAEGQHRACASSCALSQRTGRRPGYVVSSWQTLPCKDGTASARSIFPYFAGPGWGGVVALTDVGT